VSAFRRPAVAATGFAVVALAGVFLGTFAGEAGTATTTTTDTTATETSAATTETVTTATTVVTTTEVTTTETETVVPATTQVIAPPPSDDDTAWGWVAVLAGLALALLAGFLIWHRSRGREASWSSGLADLSRRTLVSLDDVARQGSVVTGQVQALAAEAQSFEARAPDDSAEEAAAQLRAGLDELAGTLAGDRRLRMSSPPPSPEQITYSTALIHEQVERLQALLRPSPPGP
jgi:hypothetical protein